jgi:hypothetical protein
MFKRTVATFMAAVAVVTLSAGTASAWMITDIDDGRSQSVVDGTVFPEIERTIPYVDLDGKVNDKGTVDVLRVKTGNWARFHCRFFFSFLGENTDKCGIDAPMPE